MSRMLVLLALAALGTLGLEQTAFGQTAVNQTVVTSSDYQVGHSTYVCPKCGKLHTRSAVPAETVVSPAVPGETVVGGPVRHVAAKVPVAASSRLQGGGPVRNVLAALNAQRRRQGIGALQFDPQLQAVAQRRAQSMASRGLKSHPPGSFSPGRYEGVGWSSSYSPSGVSACYTSDPRMRYAGAAMATGRDGVYFAVVYR